MLTGDTPPPPAAPCFPDSCVPGATAKSHWRLGNSRKLKETGSFTQCVPSVNMTDTQGREALTKSAYFLQVYRRIRTSQREQLWSGSGTDNELYLCSCKTLLYHTVKELPSPCLWGSEEMWG